VCVSTLSSRGDGERGEGGKGGRGEGGGQLACKCAGRASSTASMNSSYAAAKASGAAPGASCAQYPSRPAMTRALAASSAADAAALQGEQGEGGGWVGRTVVTTRVPALVVVVVVEGGGTGGENSSVSRAGAWHQGGCFEGLGCAVRPLPKEHSTLNTAAFANAQAHAPTPALSHALWVLIVRDTPAPSLSGPCLTMVQLVQLCPGCGRILLETESHGRRTQAETQHSLNSDRHGRARAPGLTAD
jgi:hypothetical protein